MKSKLHKPDSYPENSPDPLGEFCLAPPEYAFYTLFLAMRLRDLAFDELLEPYELNVSQWRALAVVRRLSGCTMKTLARFSTVDRTTLTRSVDQLVERGFLARETPAKDRRQISLRLTPAGSAVYDRAVKVLIAFNRQNIEGIDTERLRDACRVMQAIIRNVVGDEETAADLLTFGRPD